MTSIVKGEMGRDRTRILVNDDMKAKGIEFLWFKSPSKDAPDAHCDHYNATKAAVIAAFDPADRNLYNTKASELEEGNNPGQKGDNKKAAPGTRRYIHQQVGTKIRQFGASYDTYLNGPKEKSAGNKKSTTTTPTDAAPTDNTPTGIMTFATEILINLIKRLQKADDVPFDVVAVVKDCQKALKTIAAK